MPTTTIMTRKGRQLRIRAYSPTGDLGRTMQRAAALQQRIALLDAELRILRERLLSHVESQGLDAIESGDVHAIRKVRHSWTYSAQTEREMIALREAQKWEQSQGIAVDNPTVYVSLTTAVA